LKTSDKDRLLELLSQELKLLEQVCELTEKQSEQLGADKIDELNITLDKTQKVIEKINGLHLEQSPLMRSYDALPPGEKSDREAILNLAEQIREKLEICAGKSSQTYGMLEAKKMEQSAKIDDQSAKRKGIGGYAQAVASVSEMIDKTT